MKKFYTIFAGAIVVVFFTLTIPPDAHGYLERGTAYELPAGCGARAVAAVTSVYPGVAINNVQQWYCRRTSKDEDNPQGAFCYGEYLVSMPSDTWITKAQTDGLREWRPHEVAGDTVTVKRRTKGIGLDASQQAAHTPFVINCLRDNGGASVQWSNVVDFRIVREGLEVTIQTNYATTAEATAIAEKVITGEAISLLTE